MMPQSPGRIVFVINSIGTGGAERVLNILLDERPSWARMHEIHLVLLDDGPLMRAIAAVDHLHVLDGRGSLWRSMVQLHGLLDRLQPVLVVSFLIRANLAAACWRWRKGRAPVIVCERMHVSSHLSGRYRPAANRALTMAIRNAYRHADCVLAVSQGVADNLVEHYQISRERIETVPNPYDPATLAVAASKTPAVHLPRPYMVAVGRMVAAKNFTGLINAYAFVDPAIDLVILGEGPERATLAAQIIELGLQTRVHMPGYLANPLPVVARARFLVSASRNEGFPNAIAEAMALGVPILSTDCPSGPAELLSGHAGAPGSCVRACAGMLVPMDDPKALAHGISILVDRDDLIVSLGRAARARIDDFPQNAIVERYWEQFRTVMATEKQS